MLQSLEAKVVVLGSQGVGKTSLVIRQIGNTFNKNVSPTIGASFFTCKMNVDDRKIKLQIWDTAGQERFRSMAPMYYRKANAALLVYDITSKQSFDDMKNWVLEVKKNVDTKIVLVVVGNKADLENERAVSLNDAVEYAGFIGAKYFETSALNCQGIDDVFIHVAKALIKLEQNRFLESDGGLVVREDFDAQQATIITAHTPVKTSKSCC